jgi:hypothetical protein
LALTVTVNGWTHRYAIVDGPDYVIVGRAMFHSYADANACRRVERKVYPREHVIVHICDL